MMEHEKLRQDFPELFESDVNLSKEVLAHFGLVFSSFALLEAALQNCVVISGLNEKRLRTSLTAVSWKAEAEVLERKALAATFGSLLKLLEDFSYLETIQPKLRELKCQRDYFAHSFFREENENMFSSDRQLFLIASMADLRQQVRQAEVAVDNICSAILESWNSAKDWKREIDQLAFKLKEESLSDPLRRVGWTHSEKASNNA